MRYALLICVEEKWTNSLTEAESGAVLGKYADFMAEMGEQGVLKGGERLHDTTDATTVRVRDGQVITSDGPFAETKEQVGGFFIVDCKDLDEAIAVAAKIPGAAHGSIEVRPIWEM
jgi:hypothetical protein